MEEFLAGRVLFSFRVCRHALLHGKTSRPAHLGRRPSLLAMGLSLHHPIHITSGNHIGCRFSYFRKQDLCDQQVSSDRVDVIIIVRGL